MGYVRQDGRRVPALVGMALLERAPVRCVSLVVDLREGKRVERERAEARASEMALLEVNRHMDQFLATAAHDLRTPVSVALMGVDLAQVRIKRIATAVAPAPDCDRSAGRCDDVSSAINALEHASQAIERLSRLISRLFDVALARTGKLQLRPLPSDLVTLVREYTGAQRPLTPA